MSPIVLISGAWHGGWCWDRVAPILRKAGHTVFAPTLTGLSDRAHVLNPSVGLYTHIDDVTALVEAHDLWDATILGHSYAGQVVTGVADQVHERLSKRIYLDAFVGSDGDAAIDLLPENIAGHYRESVEDRGFGWLIPTRSLEVLGVTEDQDLQWLRPRLTPHPWRSYTEPLRLSGHHESVSASFIECVDWIRVFEPQADKASREGWETRQIATGHEAMVTAPDELAELIIELVAN